MSETLPAELSDVFWLDDNLDMGIGWMTRVLGVGKGVVAKYLALYCPTMSEYSAIEMRVIRELYEIWGCVLISRALARGFWSVYNQARDLGLKSKRKAIKGKDWDADFWPMWRDYVQEHIEEFVEVSDRVVLEPGEQVEECNDECAWWGHCDWREEVGCENYTLTDLVRDEHLKKRGPAYSRHSQGAEAPAYG